MELNVVGSLLERWTVQNSTILPIGPPIPNRVFAAIFRTYVEDLPQSVLQIVYMLLNPASNEVILILSLLSSLISAIISLTRTFTMRKANKIDSIVMLEEIKRKINHQRTIEPSVNKQAEKDNL